jgi:hypothetical protein
MTNHPKNKDLPYQQKLTRSRGWRPASVAALALQPFAQRERKRRVAMDQAVFRFSRSNKSKPDEPGIPRDGCLAGYQAASSQAE